MALLGAHVSVAGGAHRAFERGRDLGCDALQIFVKNASQWRARPLDEEVVERFREAHRSHPQPIVAHASYLINLCATHPDTLRKSRAALVDELLRCERLGVAGLVLHPGAHVGAGEAEGVEAIARSLDEALAAALEVEPDLGTRVLLENTAGQGTVLGHRFEQLGLIIGRVDAPERLGVCLDSCHAFAAGYDLRDEAGYEAMLESADEAFGLERIAAVHLNDSKFPLGERKDRHENLGEGEIGEEAFARLAGDPRFGATPLILETPLGDDELGHKRDLERLRALL